MQHPYWTPTDIKQNPIKFSRQCDRAAGKCAPLPFNMAQRYQCFGGNCCQLLLGIEVSSFIRHSRLFWKFTQNKYISVAENTGRPFCRFPEQNSFYGIYQFIPGTAVAQWWRCCATNRKVTGLIPHGITGIFHSHNPFDRTMALGSTQPLTGMSTRSISWGCKSGRCVMLTILPSSWATVT